MTLTDLDVHESELRLIPGLDVEVADTLRALKQASQDERPRLLDTTMLYAPRSGGVKRYLLSKKAWIEANRPGVSHSLIVPGARHRARADGIVQLRATRLPFGDGYRWPSSVKRWSAWVAAMKPSIIEAGDPYTPGQGALEAGQRVGCPVVGFCHSDPAGLAALHFGEWAKKPVEKRWARLFSQFDRVVSPSRFIARRLEEAGVDNIVIRPLGVEVDTFRPDRRDRSWLLKELGLGPDARLLCFAGRPAKEKNVDVLIEAVQKLGAPYYLVLVGAGSGMPAEDRVISLPYEKDPRAVAKIIASCDAFVHANDKEPFGLIVLEAMACGRPVVGVNAGGVAETVDSTVGQLAASAEADDYAQAIEALFARDIEAIGRAAREKAVSRFAWNRVFEDLCMVYGELTGEAAFVQPEAAFAVH
ncbi:MULTISPECIES: glycosyltransferase [Brevundimonas]|jgi:alpha-1,6-mannosyltransferase|uniref:glycosyltransferase n=1 Tax=Brevundimonas TaxID=41275 RepID=UPI0009E8D2C5|nr:MULTISPECIES: glycosyltransferase [Brevundimonas]MBB1178539.1 glycosyltransferase family 1 protein [Pseudomonas sp. FW305-3-2-15-E-TSA4]MCC4293838.1 glycosyltransferase [Brevundimonas aurantiaca]MEC8534523.1 glycosyltransferase [Pseudomonadota bacterium]QFU31817.1 GDP-mannose-dependent alpha-(1-6)-phosphatidylinositol dimannoside mannosyltransferase [Brevundimonas sp. Bb-A]